MEKDDLYDEAARIVVQSGQASISYLQRRLRIGFSRAARLVDMMEVEGLVSPGAGGKPREVVLAAADPDDRPRRRSHVRLYQFWYNREGPALHLSPPLTTLPASIAKGWNHG